METALTERRSPARWVRLLVVVSVACACLAANAQLEVSAGYDLFQTEEGAVDLGDLDLLCPGLGPTIIGGSTIQLRGVPIDIFGEPLGGTDTIIQRTEATDFSGSNPDAIPIEIVQLHLQSVQPFQIDCDGDIQDWMLDITEGPAQPAGTMTIDLTHANGGTFQSLLPVTPLLTFIRLDEVQAPVMHTLPQVNLQSPGGVPWSDFAHPTDEFHPLVTFPSGAFPDPPLNGLGGNDNFYAGTDPLTGVFEPWEFSFTAPAGQPITGADFRIRVAETPEPSSLVLTMAGCFGILLRRRRRE